MKRRMYRMAAWVLAVFIAAGGVMGSYSPAVRTEAASAADTHYYIYLDDARYEVTQEQYAKIYLLRDNQADMIKYLRTILGNRMPERFSQISGKIVTTGTASGVGGEDLINPSENPNHARMENGFLITNDGTLVSYSGSDTIVTVPSSVKVINPLAFNGNKTVKAIILPSSVTSADDFAFYQCPSLRYIVFTKNVSYIGSRMISQCNKLTNLVAPKNSKAYKYAVKNDIPVTTSAKPQFQNPANYLLTGDSDKQILLNNIYSVKWKSSKKKVAKVSSSGKVKAKKTGKATITATANGKKYKYKVTVLKKTEKNRVKQIIKVSVKKDMTKYEKIKAVHNWFIKNVKYDYYHYLSGNVPMVSHTAKGALLKKVAVCDGYAYAFQKVMKKLGIGCKFVVGTGGGGGHAWNMVKTGGKWYHVDVTFDDPIVNRSNANTTPYYTYFMKSSSVMKKTHSWKTGQYPKCTSKKYD